MLQEHKDYIEKMIFGNEIDDTLPAIATMLEQIVTKKKPTFDSNGLSYDLDFLEEVSYGILVLPIDIQSHFVDEQTAMLVDNNQLTMEDDLSAAVIDVFIDFSQMKLKKKLKKKKLKNQS